MDVTIACRYYEPVKAPFVHDVVLPAARAAIANGVRAHLERHWLHGPYVAVQLHGDAAAVTAATAVVRERLEAGLTVLPSQSTLTSDDLLDASVNAGLAELVPGPYEPIHADNSLQVRHSDDRRLDQLLGGHPAVEVRNELLSNGLDAIAQATGPARRTPAARVRLATSIMAAHAGAYGHGVAGGYVSFLSHLEDFLFRTDPAEQLRQQFELTWQANSDAVLGQVERAFTGSGEGSDFDSAVDTWRSWSASAVTRAESAFAAGQLSLVPGDGYAARAGQLDHPAPVRQWSDDRPLSRFHQVASAQFDVDAVAEVFGPYRFATNVLYQLLLICDVTPIERYLAAHLMSRAAATITGNDWRRWADTSEAVA